MTWMETYDAVFFVSVGTLVIGFFGLVIKYCLKSKCENVRLCGGLIVIKRRVDLETEVEMHELDAGLPLDEITDSQSNAETVRHPAPNLQKKGRPFSRLRNPKFSYPRKDLPLPEANPESPVNLPTRSESTSNSEV